MPLGKYDLGNQGTTSADCFTHGRCKSDACSRTGKRAVLFIGAVGGLQFGSRIGHRGHDNVGSQTR